MNYKLKRIKDKIYWYFAEKNWGVRREYGPYVDAHRSEHNTKRLKHWWILIRLNWHYRVLRKKTYMIEKSKKRDSNLHTTSKDDNFKFVKKIWTSRGCTDELIGYFKLTEQNPDSWKNNHPAFFLIYICCIIERNEIEEATRLLNKYISVFNKVDIYKFMPVAKLYVDLGYKDFEIEKSAFVFSQLESNRKNKVLENLFKGKNVAIVGNGPREIGKNSGKEIDAHDIVIRFNGFEIEDYKIDYGEKINVWVRNSNLRTIDRDNIEELDLIIWEPDYWHNNLLHNHLDLLYRDILVAPEKVVYMYNIKKDICLKSTIKSPTTGAQMVYWAENNKKLFSNVDYYGFSFIDDIKDSDYNHYYNEPSTASFDHQPNLEVEFLHNLIYKNKLIKKNSYKVYSCAFREYDVTKGKTGGPGGVLAMQRLLMGSEMEDVQLEYLFLPKEISYPKYITSQFSYLSPRIRDVVKGAYFIESNNTIINEINNGVTPVFVCHDLGTAYGAFLLGKKYILVYHQQGSILNEMAAAGIVVTPQEKDKIQKIEKRVLENAEKVYFPSMGAKNTLIKTSDNAKNISKINYADFALYNTIPNISQNDVSLSSLEKLGIKNINKESTEIFLSCGDFNYDKGIDRIPEFLNKYAAATNKKVLWITIGSVASNEIYNKIQSEKDNWNFESIIIGGRTDHDTLLALIEYSDYYIMFHRNSIFDLAILEAIRAGKPLLLSHVGGNIEFNVCDNVLFVEEDNHNEIINKMINLDYDEWSNRNKKAFTEHFSNDNFLQNYKKAITDLLFSAGWNTEKE